MSKHNSQGKNRLAASHKQISLEKIRAHQNRLKKEAEAITQALNLPPEMTYDVLAVLYEQNEESCSEISEIIPQMGQEVKLERKEETVNENNVLFHYIRRPHGDSFDKESIAVPVEGFVPSFERVAMCDASIGFPLSTAHVDTGMVIPLPVKCAIIL